MAHPLVDQLRFAQCEFRRGLLGVTPEDAKRRLLPMNCISSRVTREGKLTEFVFGSLLLRVIYHYWYHSGENAAILHQLGHTNLPDFVRNIGDEAPYRGC